MNPVKYSAKTQILVDAFDALPKEAKLGGYWDDPLVNPVRAEIKDHYIAEQKYTCAYCNREVVTANKALWDAEHIVPKDTAPRYMFIPQNLAISCRDCNIAKRTKEIRTTARQKFPNESKHYTIVHPHFDDYELHIRWIGDICAPISVKGAETLIVCDLTRFTAKLLGINGVLAGAGIDKHVGEILKAKTPVEAKAAMAAISVYVAEIPQE